MYDMSFKFVSKFGINIFYSTKQLLCLRFLSNSHWLYVISTWIRVTKTVKLGTFYVIEMHPSKFLHFPLIFTNY